MAQGDSPNQLTISSDSVSSQSEGNPKAGNASTAGEARTGECEPTVTSSDLVEINQSIAFKVIEDVFYRLLHYGYVSPVPVFEISVAGYQ
jgi:hypothetical protein